MPFPTSTGTKDAQWWIKSSKSLWFASFSLGDLSEISCFFPTLLWPYSASFSWFFQRFFRLPRFFRLSLELSLNLSYTFLLAFLSRFISWDCHTYSGRSISGCPWIFQEVSPKIHRYFSSIFGCFFLQSLKAPTTLSMWNYASDKLHSFSLAQS